MKTRTYRIRRPSDKQQTHWIFEVMTSDGYWLWMGSANTKKGCERRIKKMKEDERRRLRASLAGIQLTPEKPQAKMKG
jgi:Uri superfamily endonuclease